MMPLNESVNDNAIDRFVSLGRLDSETRRLIQESINVMKLAYCPYSNFQVGASVLCGTGTIYSGCNVENASYGLSICAERTAVVKAISSGERDIKILAVCADTKNGIPVPPCGACRQFIVEFAVKKDIVLYLTNPTMDKIKQTSIKELLPDHFVLNPIT